MPLDYGTTDDMRDAIRLMRAHAVNDKVGLVMRWNKRPDLIWTLYSEFMNQVDILNMPVDQRARFERWDGNADEENEIFTPSSRPTSQVGCHAEEIMIVNWNYFELLVAAAILARAEETDAGLLTERFRLREVDLVLSKSPCTGEGGSQPLRVGVHMYGTGCSMKLWTFCSLPKFRDVQWRIFYCGLPPEKSSSRLEPRAMPATLTTRKQQTVWRQGETSRLAQVQSNLSVSGDLSAILAARAAANARRARTANSASSTGAQAASSEPSTRVRASSSIPRSHFSNMVGLALRGIGRLNSLRNVSCEPL